MRVLLVPGWSSAAFNMQFKWTRYQVSSRWVKAGLYVDGAREREPVIITSEAVVSALIDGTLELDRAVQLGVLVAVR